MSFAADAGLSCPQDYSIVGFDGIGYSLFVRPSLTTIVQPRLDMARAGADLMLRALEGDPPPPETQIVMECELRLGGSTGPAPLRPRRTASIGGEPSPGRQMLSQGRPGV